MTTNPTSDPEDVANMLASLKFDCKLGYQEIMQAQDAGHAIKRWSLFEQTLAEKKAVTPVARQAKPLPADIDGNRE
jgi:hypothetical protein